MNAWENISLAASFGPIVFNFIYVSIWIHRIFKLKALYFNSLILCRSVFRNKCLLFRSAWPCRHLADATRGLNLSRQNFKCFRYCFVKYSSVSTVYWSMLKFCWPTQRQTKHKESKSLSKLWEIGNTTNKQRKNRQRKKNRRTKNEQNNKKLKKTKSEWKSSVVQNNDACWYAIYLSATCKCWSSVVCCMCKCTRIFNSKIVLRTIYIANRCSVIEKDGESGGRADGREEVFGSYSTLLFIRIQFESHW